MELDKVKDADFGMYRTYICKVLARELGFRCGEKIAIVDRRGKCLDVVVVDSVVVEVEPDLVRTRIVRGPELGIYLERIVFKEEVVAKLWMSSSGKVLHVYKK